MSGAVPVQEPPADAEGRRLYAPPRPQPQGFAFPATYRDLYDLPTSPEFLFEEDALMKTRSWSDNLTYYTGTGYLTGAASGGLVGLRRAVAEAERGESVKLLLNRALNQTGSIGRTYGNRLGVIGTLFAGNESAVRALRGGADDWVNTVAAGVGSGALYRIASGPRSVIVAGIVGGVLAGAAGAVRPLLERYIYTEINYTDKKLSAC
ncbi:hypothetical protein GUJ93_ZPchr0006g43926 [Zizania palustris]|uniref:Uncharacterized protein n=1 Tax=Zizania palustris TaxID=103762 RepID=A0A8J5S9I2_ZIZPA|nr:hypothetical protein GUJ93_ZPchr0482g33634 [Zizania palustris]KAG8071816.1 hypothetical protein GUJ93_ZPchr0006g43926 [Zizania palustris]